MEWYVLAIIIVALITILGNENSKTNGTAKDAEEFADEVTNLKQYRSLEKKVEKATEYMFNASEKTYDRASKKHDLLEKALGMASVKILQWQYVPNINQYTSKDILEHAFKIYSNEEYEQLKVVADNDNDWYGMTAEDEKEDTPSELKVLIKLQTIIEDELSQDDKIKKINSLFSRNRTSLDSFFHDDEFKAGEQWFAGLLELDGLPIATELFKDGYTTEEKCLDINHGEFLARKGIGNKKLEQLKEFQEKIKIKLN